MIDIFFTNDDNDAINVEEKIDTPPDGDCYSSNGIMRVPTNSDILLTVQPIESNTSEMAEEIDSPTPAETKEDEYSPIEEKGVQLVTKPGRRCVTFQNDIQHELVIFDLHAEEIADEIWYSFEELQDFRNKVVEQGSLNYETMLNEALCHPPDNYTDQSSLTKLVQKLRNSEDFSKRRGVERKSFSHFGQLRSLTKRKVREVVFREQARQMYERNIDSEKLATICAQASRGSVYLAKLLALADESEAACNCVIDSGELAFGSETAPSDVSHHLTGSDGTSEIAAQAENIPPTGASVNQLCAASKQTSLQDTTKRSNWFRRLLYPSGGRWQYQTPTTLDQSFFGPSIGLLAPLIASSSPRNLKSKENTENISSFVPLDSTSTTEKSQSSRLFSSIPISDSNSKRDFAEKPIGDKLRLADCGDRSNICPRNTPYVQLSVADYNHGVHIDGSVDTAENKENASSLTAVQHQTVEVRDENAFGVDSLGFLVTTNSMSVRGEAEQPAFRVSAWN